MLLPSPNPSAGVRNADATKQGAVALLSIIQRIEEIVDQETAALKSRTAIDLKAFNDKKSQALLELTRGLRPLQGGPGDPRLTAELQTLRGKLAINQAVLKMHVEAVREISTSLSDAIRDADSDGTYSRVVRKAPKKQ